MATLVTSDPHGCGLELQELIKEAGVNPKHDQLVVLGDLFDRGLHGHIIWEIMKEWGDSGFWVQGNHERKMLKFISCDRNSLPRHYYWTIDNLLKNGVRIEEIWAFLYSLPSMLTYSKSAGVSRGREIDSNIILVHAGVDVSNVFNKDVRYTVYGDFKDIPWWDRYKGEELVIYGHLSEKDHSVRIRHHEIEFIERKINSIGLDTGCATGGYLTGYIIETGEYIRVKSKDNWYDRLNEEFDSGRMNDILTPNSNLTFPTGKVIQQYLKKLL